MASLRGLRPCRSAAKKVFCDESEATEANGAAQGSPPRKGPSVVECAVKC